MQHLAYCFLLKAKGITRTVRPSWSTDSLQRSLVYGGLEGTKIRLCCRETWKNVIRPSQDVFFAFDISDAKVIDFRGARIEVIEATNERIRYRVTQAFNLTER